MPSTPPTDPAIGSFAGKVAVITGAASGIGLGMAHAFAEAGIRVLLSDVEIEALDAAAQALRESGADVHTVIADVSDPEQVQALAQAALQRYGGIDILCNNAGVGAGTMPSWHSTLDDWQWVLGVNLMGVVHGIRSFMPILLKQRTPAHIVNTASMAGLSAGGNPVYGASKAAVVSLSESLYIELQRSRSNVNVSLLCPGFVATKILSAERNRPVTLGDASEPPSSPVANAMRQWFNEQVEQGLAPLDVGRQVLAAIREQRFYVFTHPEWLGQVEHRMQNLLHGRNPSASALPGMEEALRRAL